MMDKFGMWGCISAAIACAKCAKFIFMDDIKMKMECVQFGRLLTLAIFSCSLTHPKTAGGFADYDVTQIWPGLGDDLLSFEQGRSHIGDLMDSCEFLATILMQTNDNVAILPALTLYEYLALKTGYTFQLVNARVLKARALLQAGYQ